MRADEEKAAGEHVDAAQSDHGASGANASDRGNGVLKGEDEIIRDLENTGEEVGMTWRSFLAAASMASSYNAYIFTLLIPPAILATINTELGPSPVYTWVTISWNLGGAILVTISGRLSDLFGRRWFFIAGSSLLIVGGIVGATGQSIPQMIASGAIFGAGSGFLETAYGAVQEIVPNRHRMITIGLFDAAGIISQIQPLIAWVIIKYTGNWRNCYYLMIAYHAFNLAFIFFCYHPPSFESKHGATPNARWKMVKNFDWLGLGIFVVGVTLFIIGLNWGGTLHPWTSATAICPIVIGFSMIIALGFYEVYGKVKEPLLPPRLFKNFRQFTAPMLVMSIVGMQYYSNATLWPRLSQLLYADGDISKGLYSCVVPLGSIIGGLLIMGSKVVGHQRWQIIFAIALQTACIGAMSTATLDSNVKSIILTLIISVTTTLIMLNCFVLVGFGIASQDDLGTAAGLAGTARLLFGAVATAIFSNITNQTYNGAMIEHVTSAIEGLDFPRELISQLAAAAQAGTPEAYDAVPEASDAVRAAATVANQKAYLEGARLAYLVALAFGCLGCIVAFFLTDIDPRKYTSRTVAVQEKDRTQLRDRKVEDTD